MQLRSRRRKSRLRGIPVARPIKKASSGHEESVQRRKRFLWILLRKKMTGLDRFELHVLAFVAPGRLDVEEGGRRGRFVSPQDERRASDHSFRIALVMFEVDRGAGAIILAHCRKGIRVPDGVDVRRLYLGRRLQQSRHPAPSALRPRAMSTGDIALSRSGKTEPRMPLSALTEDVGQKARRKPMPPCTVVPTSPNAVPMMKASTTKVSLKR